MSRLPWEIVIRDGFFHKINTKLFSWGMDIARADFKQNYVNNLDAEKRKLFDNNYRRVHVLYAWKQSERIVREGELSWKDILSTDDYNNLMENNLMIIGFLIVKDNNIVMIEELVPNLDIKNFMVYKFMKYYKTLYIKPTELKRLNLTLRV